MKCWLAGFLLLAAFASARAELPAKGALAPELSYTQLLQAPDGTKANWRSLHGKVVVLEFWATWCVPCVAEIPVLNKLSESLDPAKVQIISVDDENPKVVEPFLKKHPISGWVMLDTSGALYKRYGVMERPTTMVIDTRGSIVSTTIPPEHLQRDQLLALAQGKPVSLENMEDAKADAELNARVQKGFKEEAGTNAGAANALFDIALSPGDSRQDTHIIRRGSSRIDITNADWQVLLQFGAGIPGSRIQKHGTIPDASYSLHVQAPGTDLKQLRQAVELAIASGAGLQIEQQTLVEDVYLLQAVDKSKGMLNSVDGAHSIMAVYQPKTQEMQLLGATADQLAGALEEALGSAVLNEDDIKGKAVMNFKLPPHDVEAAKTAVEKNLGLTLVPAKRPVERWIVSPAEKSKEKDTARLLESSRAFSVVSPYRMMLDNPASA